MKIWKNANVLPEDVGALSGLIFALGISLVIIGEVKTKVILGATALLIASLSIISLGYGMRMWMENPPGWEDIGKLSALIGVISVAALSLGALSVVSVAGGAVLVMLGASIALLGHGMKDFMSAGVTDEGIVTVKTLIKGLMDAFKENITFKKSFQITLGSIALSKISTTLSGLAHGIKGMADLTFSEYKYDEKTGKND